MSKNSFSNNFLAKSALMREIVFGVEDGMVSTLGAVSGIAVGSNDKYSIILAGLVIISVESVSMAIGSYVANKSTNEFLRNSIKEEKEKHKEFPEEEEEKLFSMLVKDGWNKKIATKMTRVAGNNSQLLLKEHLYRELGIFQNKTVKPFLNSFSMFISYLIGGTVPLFAYFILPVNVAIQVSVASTLFGLFLLGAVTSVFTKTNFIKSGLRLTIMGGLAFLIGLAVGNLATLI